MGKRKRPKRVDLAPLQLPHSWSNSARLVPAGRQGAERGGRFASFMLCLLVLKYLTLGTTISQICAARSYIAATSRMTTASSAWMAASWCAATLAIARCTTTVSASRERRRRRMTLSAYTASKIPGLASPNKKSRKIRALRRQIMRRRLAKRRRMLRPADPLVPKLTRTRRLLLLRPEAKTRRWSLHFMQVPFSLCVYAGGCVCVV